MMRIRRFESKGRAVLAVSGRIDAEDLTQLESLLAAEANVGALSFDLRELGLVDRNAVRFLADCEAKGVKLENCPAYIREWLEAGRDGAHA